MPDTRLGGRSALQVFRDILVGIGTGFLIAFVVSAWVHFITSRMRGGVGETYELLVWDVHAIALHVGGFGLAGAIAGASRPWLGTLGGRAIVCWLASLGLYGGMHPVMPPLFDNVVIGGLVMATLATPIWLGVLRFLMSDKGLGVR